MVDYLVRRDSFWRFVRRVPQEYARLDKRGIVQQSTKVRIADDPKAIRARRVANDLNAALERFWRDLAEADSAQAVHDYHAAINAAKKLQLSPPIDEATRRTLAEALDRIEKLTGSRAEDRASVLAVYDAAPKPDLTFKQCAQRYIEAYKAGWKSAKHAAQWASTLETYAYPVIGETPVNKIGSNGGTDMVLKVLEPIWYNKTETAGRVRGRIESILDWAKARGYRDGENPARWKGHLDKLLPARSKVAPVKHHAALPYVEVPAFMRGLRAVQGSTAARALEFTILTACRTNEVLSARRSEIDLQSRMWVIPASRMKARKQHRVPLSRSAVAIVQQMPTADYVFAGKGGKPLSNMAMLKTLGRMGASNVTAHGFRSAFRDWAAENTNYPNEMIEMALAHTIDNKAEAAYRRGDLLRKRHGIMADWDRFCNSASR